MNASDRARRLFEETYRAEPTLIVRAPGRINLIGEHTDYNEGFVLPMAIDSDLVVATRRRDDSRVRVVSESEGSALEFSLDGIEKSKGWGEYVKGVAVELGADELAGWDGAVASDVAGGAGLSTSAALELATARVFAEHAGLAWDPTAMAQAAQRGENDWVGTNSGIMDQLICATGRSDHARLIDCRDLSGTYVPLPTDAVVVLLDTGTRRHLVDSEYNARRADCEEAARQLGVEQLRDVSIGELDPKRLPPVLYSRARHVVMESDRTVQAAAALSAGEAVAFGRLMNESHVSLRDDFEVSSPALDTMARIAWEAPGCYGARQTGGGFAGSCVALVGATQSSEFIRHVLDQYNAAMPHRGSASICRAADGVSVTTPA